MRSVDEKLGGRLAQLGESGELRGERGEAVLLHLDGERDAPRLVAGGSRRARRGRRRRAPDGRRRRRAGSLARRRHARLAARRVAARAAARAGGGARRGHDPRRLLARPLEVEGRDARARADRHRRTTDDARAARGRRARRAPRRAREPRARPREHAAERAHAGDARRARAELAARARAPDRARSLGPDEMRRARDGRPARGRPAAAATSRASIVLRYEPPRRRTTTSLLGLVGKSITFDTGGISIKPAGGMEDMKGDMAGGAGTLHGIGALAALGTPVRAIAVLAAAENMPGGGAFRPGDILRAANGKTIEVINTDAEGRLVLADALWYARREGATHVLDLATLTGAMELALGDLYAGVFANDDAWREQIVEAGRRSGDLVWPFPLHPALPPLHRLGLRGHEERLDAAPGLAGARRRVPAGVRRRRPVGARRHGRPGVPRAQPRRLPPGARRHRLRRPADRRAGHDPRVELRAERRAGADPRAPSASSRRRRSRPSPRSSTARRASRTSSSRSSPSSG